MEIANKTVLVLGAAGMVGKAACRLLLNERPAKLIVHSLGGEAVDTAKELQEVESGVEEIASDHGDIFVREEFRHKSRAEILQHSVTRKALIADILDDLNDELVERMALWQLLDRHKPQIVIDCINTATAIAYQNIYEKARDARVALESADSNELRVNLEHVLCSLYIPQLIRHIQILHRGLNHAKSEFYLKIGTTGTGGMGLNIPYTHGEERPSKQLMSKTAMAGAHTLLLYLMYASPEPPIVREIKPSAAIAWKKISRGVIRKHGIPIQLYDCNIEQPFSCQVGEILEQYTQVDKVSQIRDENNEVENLHSVFIDTGENGLFSHGEFSAITTQNQMEFVTPEEIAANVIYEITGSNSGTDVLGAIRSASMGPSYRAAFLRSAAIERIKKLEKLFDESVAFELLGPPRLAKLLFEAYLLKVTFTTLQKILAASAESIELQTMHLIHENRELRSRIISVGIPILLPDGESLLRGKEISTPDFKGQNSVTVARDKDVDDWADEGWVDLRSKNWEWWKGQLLRLQHQVNSIPDLDQDAQSSVYSRTKVFWTPEEKLEDMEFDIGEIVGWIFINDERGGRRGYQL